MIVNGDLDAPEWQGRVAYAHSGYSPELDKQLVEIVEKALRSRDGA